VQPSALWHIRLQHAVRSTGLLRVLLALSLAYAMFNGYVTVSQLRMPPLLVLAATQAAVLAGTCFSMPGSTSVAGGAPQVRCALQL
jgi:hypothetical protein